MGLFRKKDKGQEIRMAVQGMTCNHCVMRVQKALVGVDGVLEADVNLERGALHTDIIINGHYFQPEPLAPQVRLEKIGEEDVVQANEVTISETQITLKFNLMFNEDGGPFEQADTDELGNWTLYLVNTNDGQEAEYSPIELYDPV